MIERYDGYYTPFCDGCCVELPEQDTFEDAVASIRRNGWVTVKDEYGDWLNFCPECAEHYATKITSATQDFVGIGGSK